MMIAHIVKTEVNKKGNAVNDNVFEQVLFPVMRLLYVRPELIERKAHKKAHDVTDGLRKKIILRVLK